MAVLALNRLEALESEALQALFLQLINYAVLTGETVVHLQADIMVVAVVVLQWAGRVYLHPVLLVIQEEPVLRQQD
jgi:hypothetical protein